MAPIWEPGRKRNSQSVCSPILECCCTLWGVGGGPSEMFSAHKPSHSIGRSGCPHPFQRHWGRNGWASACVGQVGAVPQLQPLASPLMSTTCRVAVAMAECTSHCSPCGGTASCLPPVSTNHGLPHLARTQPAAFADTEAADAKANDKLGSQVHKSHNSMP